MELIRSEGEVDEPLVPWMLSNAARLSIYLVTASLFASILFVLGDPILEDDAGTIASFGVVLIVFGGLLSLPGAAIWLAALARLSPASSARRRRLIAVLMAPPTIGIVWIIEFASFESSIGYVLALIFGVLLPAGSGLVVRLRGRSRRELVDVDF